MEVLKYYRGDGNVENLILCLGYGDSFAPFSLHWGVGNDICVWGCRLTPWLGSRSIGFQSAPGIDLSARLVALQSSNTSTLIISLLPLFPQCRGIFLSLPRKSHSPQISSSHWWCSQALLFLCLASVCFWNEKARNKFVDLLISALLHLFSENEQRPGISLSGLTGTGGNSWRINNLS